MRKTLEQRIAPALKELVGSRGGTKLLAAVSGGADSTALLCLLHELSSDLDFALEVVTVNHRIRPDAESGGDAYFVESLCASFNPPIPCTRIDLDPGEVSASASERGRGIEEAARYLRYRHFESIAARIGASFILTGHNRNDQLETILMRFFQGAAGASLAGIAHRRGRYFRPLLDIEHGELCEWLSGRGISWREDATNADMQMLRNRIRNRVIPVLDDAVPGWATGASSAASRAALDEDFMRSLMPFAWKKSGSILEYGVGEFFALHPAQRMRLLHDGLVLLGWKKRVSMKLLASMCCGHGEPVRVTGAGLSFTVTGEGVFFGPDIVQNNKSGYLVYICECGRYRLPFSEINLTGSPSEAYLEQGPGPFRLPLVIRSRAGGDTVLAGDGKRKILKKLMNDWSVPEQDRNMIPVVEEQGQIRAVWGSILGYPDWYVRI